MNQNSKPLSAKQTHELVNKFTEKIGSFAVREGKIDYAERLSKSNVEQSESETRARLETDVTEKKAAIEAWLYQAQCEIEAKYEYRAKQIDRAKLTVRNQVLEGIRQSEGHQKYDLQKQMMDSAKQRDQKIALARQELAAHIAQHGDFDTKIKAIEEAAPIRLKGFKSAEKKVINAIEAPAREIAYKGGPEQIMQRTDKLWKGIKGNALLRLFSIVPGWVMLIVGIVLGGVVYVVAAPQLATTDLPALITPVLAGVVVLIPILMWAIAASSASSAAGKLAKSLAIAKAVRQRDIGPLEAQFEAQKAAFESEHQQVEEAFNAGLQSTAASAGSQRLEAPEHVDQKALRIRTRLDQWRAHQLAYFEQSGQQQLAAQDQSLTDAIASVSAVAGVEDFIGQRHNLIGDWQAQSVEQVGQMQAAAESFQLDQYWTHQSPDSWSAPSTFPEEVTFGTIRYNFAETGSRLPADPQMAIDHSGNFEVPLRLLFPRAGSILIETGNPENRELAINALNQIVGGLLTNAPPGRVSFSLIDPVGLGESFAGLMHLSDYEEHLVNKRVRTQSNQIEERLGELCEHMEKVIQMYLRNEYETISEYNQAAGTTAERYHFVVIADFPNQFSDESARRLLSIAQSGARCGVFTLVHCDRRNELPSGMRIEDLRQSSVCLNSTPQGWALDGGEVTPGAQINLLSPPSSESFQHWVKKIGEANRDSNRIQVPFSTIAPSDEEFWSVDTRDELRVPIGRTGATKLQEMAIGKGTCQHALIAGKTGSGKSTLFHVMITNMAIWCDPRQVEFYLIDFKKGVEFKAYANYKLPHARVIAIESDREFGLSVLQKLDEELKERGEKFRALGAQDVAGYFRVGGTDAVPRTLLLIDEFQEFFVEDDQISQQAAVLLDRIVRQGRAFGIHVVLGSQTLGGAFTLARATLGQMVIRIALMCNEADSYLIMDDSNPAPRLLTRPGEGIYNDQAGMADANSPFQVVWLDDEDRNLYLSKAAEAAAAQGLDQLPRVVFEGNAPASIAEDAYINNLVASKSFVGAPRLFLGAPNSIKNPTEAVFERQSGANLLVIGQRDDVVEGMVAIGLRLLVEQLGERGRLILIDGAFSDPNANTWLKESVAWLGDKVVCPDAHEMGDVINQLAGDMKGKSDGTIASDDSTTFLFILGLQKYKKLRFEEDFSFSLDEDAEVKPANSLNDLITEGPSLGYHTIVSIDTYNNLNRCISRKAVGEFEKKILFQMSAGDSSSLIDTSKASTLGMNRAIYYNEPTGVAETFRPYSQPSRDWF